MPIRPRASTAALVLPLAAAVLSVVAALPATARAHESPTTSQPAASSLETPGQAEGVEAAGVAESYGWQKRVDDFFGTYLVKPLYTVLFFDFGTKRWLGTEVPIIVLWLLLGAIFFTVRMGFINFRGFWHAIQLTRGDYDNPDETGEVSHFQALASALSATIGLGNIAGVAIAVGTGGPGAIFWMIVAGLLGMSSKFAECSLSQMYRRVDLDGTVSGGPMHYLYAGLKEIRIAGVGLGPFGAVLGVVFALFCMGGSFGGGCAFQVNQSLGAVREQVKQVWPDFEECRQVILLRRDPVKARTAATAQIHEILARNNLRPDRAWETLPAAEARELLGKLPLRESEGQELTRWLGLRDLCDKPAEERARVEAEFGWTVKFLANYVDWVYGLVMAVLVGLVIIGGIRRIARTAEKIVPLMCIVYMVTALCVLLCRYDQIGGALAKIFSEAFCWESAYGGFLGVLVVGIRRAAFSNEAGIGSAAIAHAAAKTEEPIREGIVASLGPFIDTVVICTMTGLVILVTGAYNDPQYAHLVAKPDGAALTSKAMGDTVSWFPWILCLSVILFAYSTMISWSYYGERCWSHLFGSGSALAYRVIFLVFVVLGAVVAAQNVLDFSDLMILSMAFPNILGVALLSGKIRRALDDYWRRYKAGEMERR